MKLIVNQCYGGFGLSMEAKSRYAELQARKVFFYRQNKYKHRDGVDEYEKVSERDLYLFVFAVYDDLGPKCSANAINKAEWLDDLNLERNDPLLLQVVEELGRKASGKYAKLEIVEIPDGVDWKIEEYDGQEWVAEAHRTW
jgi:hypothetical protein